MTIFSERRNPFAVPNYDLFAPARLQDPRGILEGAPLDGPNHFTPWIGLTTIRELALQYSAEVGLVDVDQVAELQSQVADLDAEVERLRAVAQELEAYKQNVVAIVRSDHDIKMRVAKRQGPQVKPQEVSV
jgi:hypothetical protein